MVNKLVATLVISNFDGDQDTISEICGAMDDLCHYSLAFKYNILHIHQRQQDNDLPKNIEVLDL